MGNEIENEVKGLELVKLGVDVPSWINQDITLQQALDVAYGGCESGAYMPAVTYWQALETMGKYGDDVLQYIDDAYGRLPEIPCDTSWAGIAVHCLSCAVNTWCSGIDDDEHDIIERYWETLQESLKLEVIDDWGFPGSLWLFGNEYGYTHLICADSLSSAFDAWVDEQTTVPLAELHEAYGHETSEAMDAALEEYKELAEGYYYQANGTGTGVVWVGYYQTIRETTLKEVIQEFTQ